MPNNTIMASLNVIPAKAGIQKRQRRGLSPAWRGKSPASLDSVSSTELHIVGVGVSAHPPEDNTEFIPYDCSIRQQIMVRPKSLRGKQSEKGDCFPRFYRGRNDEEDTSSCSPLSPLDSVSKHGMTVVQ
ncbi:hypothetical protein ACFLXA_01780 [Chloroflexota bacterium]